MEGQKLVANSPVVVVVIVVVVIVVVTIRIQHAALVHSPVYTGSASVNV